MPGLPTPRTTTEELLVALTLEVQGLRADLNAARGGGTADPEATGQVAVSELTSKQPSPPRRPSRRS